MDCEENPADINSLLNSFSSLQTSDHDDLVCAFQNIANELSYTTARFFLEMNNWWVFVAQLDVIVVCYEMKFLCLHSCSLCVLRSMNLITCDVIWFSQLSRHLAHLICPFRNLQAAVCCYFDFVASSNQNGLQPMPSMRVVKELTIGLGESVTPNTPFTQSWLLENNGTVAWPQGCYLKLVSEINNDGKMFVPSIAPNDTHILTINLVSPSEFGQFKSQFCMCTPPGVTFGPIIWSVVDVSPAGTLALTQQLTQLHTSEHQQQPVPNVGCANWDEDGMQGTATSMALVPHCSNISGQLQVRIFASLC